MADNVQPGIAIVANRDEDDFDDFEMNQATFQPAEPVLPFHQQMTQHISMVVYCIRCGHGYHVECLEAWLKEHPNCPLCRTPVSGSHDQDNTTHNHNLYLKKFYDMVSRYGTSALETMVDWLTSHMRHPLASSVHNESGFIVENLLHYEDDFDDFEMNQATFQPAEPVLLFPPADDSTHFDEAWLKEHPICPLCRTPVYGSHDQDNTTHNHNVYLKKFYDMVSHSKEEEDALQLPIPNGKQEAKKEEKPVVPNKKDLAPKVPVCVKDYVYTAGEENKEEEKKKSGANLISERQGRRRAGTAATSGGGAATSGGGGSDGDDGVREGEGDGRGGSDGGR
ncbi:Zinc finger, RING/FYVE/PHD-type, partial [Cynara cardunculus var. scolymus]